MDSGQEFKLIINLSQSGQELLKRGLKILGPGTGAYLGALTTDPAGVVPEAAMGEVISQKINDFAERSLSEREKNNISITQAFSIAKICDNNEACLTLNQKYFEGTVSGNAYELYQEV